MDAAAEYARWFEDYPLAGVFTMMLIVVWTRGVNKIIGGLSTPQIEVVGSANATTNTDDIETTNVGTAVDMETLYKETSKYFGGGRKEEQQALEGVILIILDSNVYQCLLGMEEVGRLQNQKRYWLQEDEENYCNCFRHLSQPELSAIGSLATRQAWDRLIDRVAVQHSG
jgi:hypothetical protein